MWEVVADPPEGQKYGGNGWGKHGYNWDFPPRSEDDSEDDNNEDLKFELSSTSLALADRAALDAARAKYTERESRLAAFAAGTVTFNRLKVADPNNGCEEDCIYEAKGELLNGRPQYVPVEEEENRVHSCLHFDGSAWRMNRGAELGGSDLSMISTQGSSALIPEEVVEWECDGGHYQSYCSGTGEANVAILPGE